MKHVFVLASLVCLATTSPTPAAAPEEPTVCLVEICPYPGRDAAMWDGLYAARDGRVYSGLISEGESAHLYVYDPAKKRNEMLFDLADVLNERGKGIRTSGKLHNKPVEDDQGNLYFVPLNNGSGPRSIDFTSWKGGRWLRYDPRSRRLDDLGLVDEATGIYPLTIDTRRRRLFGINFTGYLYRFDIPTRTTKNLGRVSNWDVCRDIFCDDRGNVYGSVPVGRVWKYDAATEQVLDLAIRIPHDPTMWPTQLRNPMIDRSYDWRAVEWDPVGKAAYGVTCGSGSLLFRFDPHEGAEGTVTPLVRLCDSRFLAGDRKDIPYSPLSFAVDPVRQKVYFVPSARPYAIGGYVETFGSSEVHHLIEYDIARAERIDRGAMQTADGRRVFGCEAASVAPDGTLYICGQAEVRDKGQATGTAAGTPVALHLVIVRPEKSEAAQ